MDVSVSYNVEPSFDLSYDEVPYEEQFPEASALASRIGTSKVYLLSESSTAKPGKRKREEELEDGSGDMQEEETNMDLGMRGNAILLQGAPIAQLPTARLFAYATHFDCRPLGLEWIDDQTCVFVFDSVTRAREAFRYFTKSPTEKPDNDGSITAKALPIALWLPDDRITESLGRGEGVRGIIRMRWARKDDVKKKGAQSESQFYRKHGKDAGKDIVNGRDLPMKRRRRDYMDNGDLAARLDLDLEEFLAEADDPPASPPSKMRSDYIGNDGRPLVEPTDLVSRITAPLPRRRRGSRWPLEQRMQLGEPRRSTGGRGGRRHQKSQQELDDELDAFLKEPAA